MKVYSRDKKIVTALSVATLILPVLFFFHIVDFLGAFPAPEPLVAEETKSGERFGLSKKKRQTIQNISLI